MGDLLVDDSDITMGDGMQGKSPRKQQLCYDDDGLSLSLSLFDAVDVEATEDEGEQEEVERIAEGIRMLISQAAKLVKEFTLEQSVAPRRTLKAMLALRKS